jgi:hypothetical protein
LLAISVAKTAHQLGDGHRSAVEASRATMAIESVPTLVAIGTGVVAGAGPRPHKPR